MLISHGFGLSPPDDHLISKCRSLANLLTPPERLHLCVLISNCCGILGRGDLVEVTLYVDIWVGRFGQLTRI